METKNLGRAKSGTSKAYLPQVAKGAMINLSGTVVRTLLASGYTVLLARMLPVSELGEYFLIVTVVNILGLASTVGLDYGVVRYVALYAGEGKIRQARRATRTALIIGVSISLIVTVAVIALAPSLVTRLLEGGSDSVTMLRLFSLSIPFWVMARLFNATTQGLHRMRYQVYSRDLGEQLSKFGFTAIALILGTGLLGAVVANVASVVLAMLLAMVFTMKLFSPRIDRADPNTKEAGPARNLIRYSYPLAFSNILGMLLVWMDMLLMGYLGSATDVGYYGAALRVAVVSSTIFLAVSTVFMPVISDFYNRHFTNQLHSLYKTVTRWIFVCTLPLVLLQLFFADPIMKIFGPQFSSGSGALMILALSQLVNAVTGPAGYMVLMSGHSRIDFINISVSLAVNIAICLMMIPTYGIIGAATANFIASVVLNLMRALEVWFLMHSHAYDRNYIKPVVAGGLSALVTAQADRFMTDLSGPAHVLLQGTLLSLVFLAGIGILGINEQDREVMLLIKSRLFRFKEIRGGKDIGSV